MLAEHPHLTLTGLYNVLEKLCTGSPDALDAAGRRIFDDGLVLILNLTESESRGPPPLRINYAVRFGHQQEGCWDESPIGGQQQVAICGLSPR